MAYKKKAGQEFFTDLNGLKHHWTAIIENINSSPKEQIEAIKWLMYLSAETEATKNVASFALMVHYGARVGYRMPEGVADPSVPADPIDNMVAGMMQHLFDKRESNV